MDHLITVTDELSQKISNIQKLNILSDNSSLEKINSIILAVLNRSFQLYTYISAFFNPELKKYISDRIFKETGITIEMDENIDTSDIFKSDKQAQYIANKYNFENHNYGTASKPAIFSALACFKIL